MNIIPISKSAFWNEPPSCNGKMPCLIFDNGGTNSYIFGGTKRVLRNESYNAAIKVQEKV